jgi:hypothetical protein
MRGQVMWALAVALALAVGILVVEGTPADGARPGADAAAKARGRLVFTTRFDESAGPYVEGSVPFLLVRDARGNEVVRRRVSAGRTVVWLPSGSYSLAAYWRPCEGACIPDDLPTDRCGRRFSIHTARRGASETVDASAVFRGGQPCRLRVESDWPPTVVVRTGRAKLQAARGPYCRPGCSLPPSQPRTKRRLPIHAGSRISINLKEPTRRLELSGICGRSPLSYARGGRRWSFRVPPDTPASIQTCHDLKLTVTYAGPGARRGVKAVFGFTLRVGR